MLIIYSTQPLHSPWVIVTLGLLNPTLVIKSERNSKIPVSKDKRNERMLNEAQVMEIEEGESGQQYKILQTSTAR